MNNWLTILLAVGLGVLVIFGSTFVGINIGQNSVPKLTTNNAVKRAFNEYRANLYHMSVTNRGYKLLPKPLDSLYPGKHLYVDYRILTGGHYLSVREYYLDPQKDIYPILVLFDVDGDGIFGVNEGYLLSGNPLTNSPVSAGTVSAGLRGLGGGNAASNTGK